MFKMFKIFMFLCSFFLVSNAEALVVQQASKALSFRNVVNNSNGGSDSNSFANRGAMGSDDGKAMEHHITPPETIKVDLTSINEETVSLRTKDSVEITLGSAEGGNEWMCDVDSNVYCTTSTAKITCTLRKAKATHIGINLIDADGNTLLAKKVTINLR